MDRNLDAIRQRDKSYGEKIPEHYQGPQDRRYLLSIIDSLTKENQTLIKWITESK